MCITIGRNAEKNIEHRMMNVEFRNMDMNDELGWPAVGRSFEKWKN